MSDTSGSKTEKATPKRMQELRKKGQLGSSHDLTAWLAIGAGGMTLGGVVGSAAAAGTDQFATVKRIIQNPDPAVALSAMTDAFGSMGGVLAPLFVAAVLGVVGGAIVQGGIRFKSLTPKFEHLDLLKGVQRIFSLQSLWEGGKALLKSAAVALALIVVVQGLIPTLMNAGGLTVTELIGQASSGTVALFQSAVVAGLALAGLDVFMVIRRNMTRSKMSKEEIKQEHKQSDGDPLVKGQRRSRQLAISRNRMIAAVQEADVVLVNPTHYAVALGYEPGKSAPRVLAKGSDEVALRIREEAATHRVPLVKDIALTRSLHATCKVGDEIPADAYGSVARVLAFVMALKLRGQTSGVHVVPSPALLRKAVA